MPDPIKSIKGLIAALDYLARKRLQVSALYNQMSQEIYAVRRKYFRQIFPLQRQVDKLAHDIYHYAQANRGPLLQGLRKKSRRLHFATIGWYFVVGQTDILDERSAIAVLKEQGLADNIVVVTEHLDRQALARSPQALALLIDRGLVSKTARREKFRIRFSDGRGPITIDPTQEAD